MKSIAVHFMLLSLSRWTSAGFVNRTIDDADSAMLYSPSEHWHPSTNNTCPGCVLPSQSSQIYHGTYHFGSHVVPKDPDDQNPAIPEASSSTSAPAAPTTSTTPAPAATGGVAAVQTEAGGKQKGKGKGGGGGGDTRELSKRTDADDPNFMDTPVNATLTFNGTAVYVYCIVPTQTTNASATHSNMTFMLDGAIAGNFIHTPQNASTASFNFSQLVFQQEGLTLGQHTLMIMPKLGSVAMLDFVNFTTLDTGSDPSDPSPSGSVDSQTGKPMKKNVATFAIAIGATMGVLLILSSAVAISLYRRRKRSAFREKLREAQEASRRPPSPEMRGPHPFIPRYFPGTVLRQPDSPPPFSASASTGLSRRSSRSSLGPSHGLNYPLAPEIPAYSPPEPPVVTEVPRPLPISIVHRAPVSRLQDDDEIVPPSYHEVEQTSPVTILPPFTTIAPTSVPNPSIRSSSPSIPFYPPSITELPPSIISTSSPSSSTPLIRRGSPESLSSPASVTVPLILPRDSHESSQHHDTFR